MLKDFIKLDYYDELLEILFNNKSGVIGSNLVAPLFIIYFLYEFVPFSILFIFAIIQFSLGFLRLWVSKKGHDLLVDENRSESIKYLKYLLVIIFLSALLIGCASFLCIYYEEVHQVYLLMALIFILLSGSITTLTSVFHAYLFFNLPILIILVSSLLISNRLDSYIIAAIITIYAVITLPASFRIFQSLKTNIEKTKLIKNQQEQLLRNQENIIRSEKMASMGEMIGNIAHQWRQPLQAISILTQKLQITKMINGTITDEDIESMENKVAEQLDYLSDTIETFRNFIKEDKKKEEAILQKRIDNVLNLIGAAFKNKHIKIINNIDYSEPIKLTLILGELSQAIINILNNAKDVLLEKKIRDAWIKIDLVKEENKVIITIEDNAGGIPEEMIHKIFEPYFTTKHKSKGTGLGLHMSYKIIVESLKGDLYVENTQNGAKFFIELPLS